MLKCSPRCSIVFLVLFLALTGASCDRIQKSIDLLSADTAYNQGNFSKAISVYQKLVQNDPSDPELHWKLGIVYYSNNNHSLVEKQIAILRKLKSTKFADDLEQLLYSHE